MGLMQEVQNLAIVDIFKEAKKPDLFVGSHFTSILIKAYLLITGAWKEG